MWLRMVGPTRSEPVTKEDGAPAHRFYEVTARDGSAMVLIEIENPYIVDHCAEGTARLIGLHHLLMQIAEELR